MTTTANTTAEAALPAPPNPPSGTATGRPARRAVLAVGVVTAAVLIAALPWLVNAYLISLAATALIMAVLAMSAQIPAGLAGLPPLGQASYLGVGAYTAHAVATTVTASGPVQLAAAALAGAVAAAVTGVLCVRGRGTTFLMLTFAVGELLHAAAIAWAPGGSEGVHIPPVVALPGLAPMLRDGHTYLYVLACTAAIGAVMAVLVRSRFALLLRGIAAHEPRMQAAGQHTGRLLLAAYITAGAVAGAAGALSVAVHRYVSPADLSFGVSALALAAALAGVGSMTGACVGAVLLVAVRDLAGGYLDGHGPALLGLLFIVIAYTPRHYLPTVAARMTGRWWP
jgi:branched-chain amino acid transport system permease protein